MLSRILAPILVAGGLALAGCADGSLVGSNLTTASIDTAAKADPVCAPLSQQISALRAEGVADKVAKAADRKYKMKTADLAKADQLNKANAEFQAKCSTSPASAPQQTAQADTAAAAATTATAKTANAAAAKAVDAGSQKAAAATAKAATAQ